MSDIHYVCRNKETKVCLKRKSICKNESPSKNINPFYKFWYYNILNGVYKGYNIVDINENGYSAINLQRKK